MTAYSDAEKLAEVRRELAMRRRVYPERVAAGRMPERTAARNIAIMEQIAADYEAKIASTRLL